MYKKPDLRINLIPISFDKDSFIGGVLPYVDKDHLRELKESYRDSHVIKRNGNAIQCVPYSDDALPLGKEWQFSIWDDFRLAARLVRESIIRFLRSKRQSFRRLINPTSIIITKKNLMQNIVEDEIASIVPMYPEYRFDSKVIIPYHGKVKFGILLDFNVSQLIEATVMDLLEKGVDVKGCYVLADNEQKSSSIINKRIEDYSLIGYQVLLYNYAKYLLDGSIYDISLDIKKLSIEELSIMEYSLRRNMFRHMNQVNILLEIREHLINTIVKSDITDDIDEKAAFIWIAVNESLSIDIHNYLLSANNVSVILARFENAMKRWRYDSDELKQPIKWPIESEREIQDILWLILRSYFDDLIDEEVLPQFGHSFYKPDFAIPALRLLIEVKYAYKKKDFKKLEQEIMIDSVAYLSETQDYDKIIVFIYDESSSVQEHDTTKRDLKKLDAIEDIIIVSKPSQIKRGSVS